MSGELRPGDRVPSELELVAHYGCSRMTVNKALSLLAADGLIVRKRRSGSFVATPKSQETVLKIHDVSAEIKASRKSYRHEILSRRFRKSTRSDAERLEVEPGSRVLALALVHYASDIPYVLEDRLIGLESVPEAEDADFGACPPGAWLLEHVPWSQAEHRIRAVAADEQTAGRLKIKRGSPCLLVDRKTWHGGLSITQVWMYYPGDRHELIARFDPGGAVKSNS